MEDVIKTGLKFKVNDAPRGTPKVLPTMVSPLPTPPKKNKYGAVKTDGFHSKHEANVFKKLQFKESANLLTGLQCQVHFKLSVCKYIADFVYYDLEIFQFVVMDAKGVRTPEYKLKAKMMLNELKISILEV